MINFPMFIEGLLMPLLGLGVFVVYKRSKKKIIYEKIYLESIYKNLFLKINSWLQIF